MSPEQVYEALAAAADGVGPAEATWEELKPRVLAQAGVSSEQEDPLLYQVVSTIEQVSEDDQRELFFDRDRLWQVVAESAAAVEPMPADALTEAAAADTSQAAEPYWDGEKWLRYDVAAGEWVPMETPAAVDDETHDSVIQQMAAEDPEFAAALKDDPALADQLRAMAAG